MHRTLLYTIVSAPNVTALTALVEARMKQGWTPQGGVFVAANVFYQGMIKTG